MNTKQKPGELLTFPLTARLNIQQLLCVEKLESLQTLLKSVSATEKGLQRADRTTLNSNLGILCGTYHRLLELLDATSNTLRIAISTNLPPDTPRESGEKRLREEI